MPKTAHRAGNRGVHHAAAAEHDLFPCGGERGPIGVAQSRALPVAFLALLIGSIALHSSGFAANWPGTLNLVEPMGLAARAIPPRLDPAQNFRPWFLLRGSNGVPAVAEHSSWDLGDMGGRYLEALILARRMGVTAPELSQAEERLQRFLFGLLGPEGLVMDPAKGKPDHSFAQGSALYGMLALFEDSADPAVRQALERLITAQKNRAVRDGARLVDKSVALPHASGSHLAGYQIFPIIRFYEETGYPDAKTFAEGLSAWVLSDPVLGPDGAITQPLSWEGHIHSWVDALAGCVRTARVTGSPNLTNAVSRARSVYEWVKKSNATSFGWVATYPTGGSSETCAISSMMRLALELSHSGLTEYLDDVERFARNQLVEAQFKSTQEFQGRNPQPTTLITGCFDSQSMPNHHLGTRGGEDVGTVEGCCLNGGMRGLYLAWNAIQEVSDTGTTINLWLNRAGPAADVISYVPGDGRLEVIPRFEGPLKIRLPKWAKRGEISLTVDKQKAAFSIRSNYVALSSVPAGSKVVLRLPLREVTEQAKAGTNDYRVTWRGDTVVEMRPEWKPASLYQGRPRPTSASPAGSAQEDMQPDTWQWRDAARLAESSMLARLDLHRQGQPFFRLFPLATPPYAQHEKWDDGDMTGRYVEALILSRAITGSHIDARENLLRDYLVTLFDLGDGLCYTQPTAWTPRRACLFSQSSVMIGLLAWHHQTGSPEARKLLDWQVNGLMRIAVRRGDTFVFPKYEYDGVRYVNEPADKDAPPWYAGRLLLPLVDYWQLSQRSEVEPYIEGLVNHCVHGSNFIGPNGEVQRGEGWWGHLHGTMDMASGVVNYGRLSKRPELVEWAKRIYDRVGKTQTTRYGFVADVSGGSICESCGIGSRVRLGLSLYAAGAADPFGEIDRFLRNQLLENQFVNVSFMKQQDAIVSRTDRAVYHGIDRMLRGTFQCWGTANDLLGSDDVEGCGAAGGVQALALAYEHQGEWREIPQGRELRIHLLVNRLFRAVAQLPFTTAAPVALELWSHLPYEGKVEMQAHEPIDRVSLRIPDGCNLKSIKVGRRQPATGVLAASRKAVSQEPELSGRYVQIQRVKPGEEIEINFELDEYSTRETAAGKIYTAKWKGDSVVDLVPKGAKLPLYQDRAAVRKASAAPLSPPRY